MFIFIKKHNQIENVIVQEHDKYDFSGLTPEIIKKVRKLFLFPEVNNTAYSFHWNYPNKTGVLKLLCEEHYLNKKRVESNLFKLSNNYEMCKEYFLKIKNTSRSIKYTYVNQTPLILQVRLQIMLYIFIPFGSEKIVRNFDLNSSLEDITEKLGLFSEDEKKFLAQSH